MTLLEMNIAEFLVHNQAELKDKIDKRYNPSSLFSKDILEEYYSIEVIDMIKREIEHSFMLTPEDLHSIINKEFVSEVLTKDFLKPKETI